MFRSAFSRIALPSLLLLALSLLDHGPTAMAQTESEVFMQVRQQLAENKLDDALKTFEAAAAQNPTSAGLRSLHTLLAMNLARAKRPLEAAQQMEQALTYQLDQATKSGQPQVRVANLVEMLATFYQQAEQAEKALERVDHFTQQAADAQLDTSDFRRAKVLVLIRLNRAAEAQTLVDTPLQDARAAFAAEANDATTRQLADALQLRSHFLRLTSNAEAQAAADEYLGFLASQFESRKGNPGFVSQCISEHLNAAMQAVAANPALAEQRVAETRKLINALGDAPQAADLQRTQWERAMASIERRLETARLHAALIGQDAIPLDLAAWVNGAPLTADDLKGKVVLLDFWAVWCGPCIATFPHLRAWHEKYRSRGFEIVGVTRYYQYDWDDETQRAKRVEGLEPAAEEAALVKFADFHQLRHRFAVLPQESEFNQKYGVTGIPQAVLIDRQGKVRMIRVGSGDQNAHALQTTIETLLDENPASGN